MTETKREGVLFEVYLCLVLQKFLKDYSALMLTRLDESPGGLLKYDLGRDVPLRLEK